MKGKKASAAAASGAVALIFLILGFQIAIFTGNVFKFRQQAKAEAAADGYGEVRTGNGNYDDGSENDGPPGGSVDVARRVEKILSRATPPSPRTEALPNRESNSAKDNRKINRTSAHGERGAAQGTIFSSPLAAASEPKGSPGGKGSAVRKALEASGQRERDFSDSRTVIAERTARKAAETFAFDPNTVTLEGLCRLGFSERQAQVILNYRDKGGRFRSEQDFAKMYVVDSATFARLQPYIRIPKLDLNAADSEALIGLRGIGPYYASKILDYRRRLGGSFTSLDQLLEIDGFDRGRLDGFRSDVEIRKPPKGFNIWEATQAQLEAHPYIGSYAAKGIIRFKRTVDTLSWTLSNLVEAGILSPEKAAKL